MYESSTMEPRGEARGSRSWKTVYTIVQRQGMEKKLWVRIGTAFVNSDQSINVKLDALPIDGQIHIRDPDEAELERSRQRREARMQRGGAQDVVMGGVA